MDNTKKAEILNYIEKTLDNIEKFNMANTVEDAVAIKEVFTNIVTKKVSIKQVIKKLRAILRENEKVFCGIFSNVVFGIENLFKTENEIEQEAIFLMFDIIKVAKINEEKYKNDQSKNEFRGYLKEWMKRILFAFFCFLNDEVPENPSENYKLIKNYMNLWFDYLGTLNDCREYIIYMLLMIDFEFQKTAIFFLFKYLDDVKTENVSKCMDWSNFLKILNILNTNQNQYIHGTEVATEIYKKLHTFFISRSINYNGYLVMGTKKNVLDYGKINNCDISNALSQIRELEKYTL